MQASLRISISCFLILLFSSFCFAGTNTLKVIFPENDSLKSNKSKIKQSGFTNITEFNFGSGVSDYNNGSSYGIQTINGYLIKPNFSFGLGIGVDKYPHLTMMPVFLDVRTSFQSSTVSPFLSITIGYSKAFSDFYDGGTIINPTIGIKYFFSHNNALVFSVGYRLQELIVSNVFFSKVKSIKSFNIKMGITF